MIHEFTLVLDRELPRRDWGPWPRPGWTRSALRAHTQSWHTFSAAAALPAAIITAVRAIEHLGIAAIKIRSAHSILGFGFWRRSTAACWRSTSNSASFDAAERDSSAI
jgi:hypothetical protein